jgi:hypothetical protein
MFARENKRTSVHAANFTASSCKHCSSLLERTFVDRRFPWRQSRSWRVASCARTRVQYYAPV